jgi:hypothetical protein
MTTQREEQLISQLEGMIVELDQIADQSRREDAERDEQRAEDARSGKLGRDWQDVQRRIDAGQTTLLDVFSGRDESPAAVRLLGQSQANLTAMAMEAEPPQEVEDELAAAEAQWTRLQEGGR